MSTASNYRSKNYQDYVDDIRSKMKVEKSISDIEKKKIDSNVNGDNDSINSCAESLNNYLDVKVGVFASSEHWIIFIIHHW